MKQIRILPLLCVLISGHTWLVMAEADTQQEETFNHQTKEINYWIGELGQGQPGDNNPATEKIIAIGKPAIPHLINVLEKPPSYKNKNSLSDEHWVRLRAAHCLSVLNWNGISEIISQEIHRESNPNMRFIYALYLSRHDSYKTIQFMIEDLKRDVSTARGIVATLKNINNTLAIPFLKPLVQDKNPNIRFNAAEVLTSLGDESGYDILLSELHNDKYSLRAALCLPVEYIEETRPVLEANKNSPDSAIREQIEEQLVQADLQTGERGLYFAKKVYKSLPLPSYEAVKDILPSPIIESNPEWIDMYWFCWKTAFNKLKKPLPGSPFVSNYIDEGFGPHIFQWDTHFMIMFWKYAHHIFPSIESHDNFYVSQEADGYICREIRETDGTPFFFRGKDNTINPPLFAWVEYDYYRMTGDDSRFHQVFPPIERYMEWIEKNRKYLGVKHSLYWQTNLGSGMDNSLRTGTGWVDISSQIKMSYDALAKIAEHIGNSRKAEEYKDKSVEIKNRLNEWMWNSEDGLYYDAHDFGEQHPVKSIACFWPLWAGVSTKDQAEMLVANLQNSETFWRCVPFPTLAADQDGYFPQSGYWLGNVWAPTNYMVMRGLEKYGYHDFAYYAGVRFLDGMAKVYEKTGTVWENYDPDSFNESGRANRDFVGWTGLGPISILIENIIGIEVNAPANTVTWQMKRLDRHGIKNLHFGKNTISLIASARNSEDESNKIQVIADKPFTLAIMKNGSKLISELKSGKSGIDF